MPNYGTDADDRLIRLRWDLVSEVVTVQVPLPDLIIEPQNGSILTWEGAKSSFIGHLASEVLPTTHEIFDVHIHDLTLRELAAKGLNWNDQGEGARYYAWRCHNARSQLTRNLERSVMTDLAARVGETMDGLIMTSEHRRILVPRLHITEQQLILMDMNDSHGEDSLSGRDPLNPIFQFFEKTNFRINFHYKKIGFYAANFSFPGWNREGEYGALNGNIIFIILPDIQRSAEYKWIFSMSYDEQSLLRMLELINETAYGRKSAQIRWHRAAAKNLRDAINIPFGGQTPGR